MYANVRKAASKVMFVRDERRVVKVTRWVNEGRGQSITVVPTPRLATKTFFDDWVKQPYIKDSMWVVSKELLAPFTVLAVSGAIEEEKSEPYAWMRTAQTLSAKDMDMLETDFARRAHYIGPGIWGFLLPVCIRDASFHPWVVSTLLKNFGPKAKAGGDEWASSVLLIVPGQAPTAIKVLEHGGFKLDAETEVDVGADALLCEWEDRGAAVDAFMYGLVCFLLGVQFVSIIAYLVQDYVEFKEKRMAEIAEQERQKEMP